MGAVLATCLSFLLGSFPSGVVLGRLASGRDIRQTGSGNIGAANVAREMGFTIGAGVALLDIVKGIVAVSMAIWMGLGHQALAVVALAAVLGHDFSLFLRFRGGKGVATTLGVSLVLAPVATVLAMATWVALVVIRGYASLASLVALALLPVYMGLTGGPPSYVVLTFTLFLLAAVKHWANILRLLRGTEPGLTRRFADGG